MLKKCENEKMWQKKYLGHLEVPQKREHLPCEQFLRQIEISRAFLPPVSHGEKCGKFQFVVESAHEAVVLIFFPLDILVKNSD